MRMPEKPLALAGGELSGTCKVSDSFKTAFLLSSSDDQPIKFAADLLLFC